LQFELTGKSAEVEQLQDKVKSHMEEHDEDKKALDANEEKIKGLEQERDTLKSNVEQIELESSSKADKLKESLTSSIKTKANEQISTL